MALKGTVRLFHQHDNSPFIDHNSKQSQTEQAPHNTMAMDGTVRQHGIGPFKSHHISETSSPQPPARSITSLPIQTSSLAHLAVRI